MSPGNQNKTARIKLQADPVDDLELIQANLAKLRADAETIAEHAAKLEKNLRMARGTREIKQRVIDPAHPFLVGPDAPTEVLYDAVLRAITAPDVRGAKTLREIVELTGEPNRNRIGGAIIKFQQDGLPVKNVGSRYRALWLHLPKRKA
jgi:hypothetical protein